MPDLPDLIDRRKLRTAVTKVADDYGADDAVLAILNRIDSAAPAAAPESPTVEEPQIEALKVAARVFVEDALQRALAVGEEHRKTEGELTAIAARLVRHEGGCESGHKAGNWHLHSEAVLEVGRSIAACAHRLRPARPHGAQE